MNGHPSYKQGFARSAGESKYPNLWKGLLGAWVPALGVTGSTLRDVTPRIHNGSISGSVWLRGSGFNYDVLAHDTLADKDVLASDSRDILPTQNVSIVLGYEKRDATNRNSGAFGIDSAVVGERCGAHLPFSDGTVYWDFGGATSGSTRLSVGGLTFGADNWVFNTGARGMEIWQNSILRASNSANPTLTVPNKPYALGIHQTNTTDLADYAYFYIFNRQLTSNEIEQLHINPLAPFQLADNIVGFVAPVVGGISIPVVRYYRERMGMV